MGFGWHPPGTDELFKACSGECAELLPRMALMAKDLEKFERIALEKVGAVAGQYLEDIGKTSMTELSFEEWTVFLETVLKTFGDSLKGAIQEREVPF